MLFVGTAKECPSDFAAGSLWKVRYPSFLGVRVSLDAGGITAERRQYKRGSNWRELLVSSTVRGRR
jgi:hypothetical protein